MRIFKWMVALAILAVTAAISQPYFPSFTSIVFGVSLPGTCVPTFPGTLYAVTTGGIYYCSAPNAWSRVAGNSDGGGVWGAITGTLSTQTDLQTALNSKAATTASTTVNGTVCALGSSCAPSTTPTGSASGDLSGSYPSPTVAKVNGNTPGGPCTNQFARSIDSSGRPTCATVANTDLANSSVTVGGVPCTLGGSCVPGTTVGGFQVGQAQTINSAGGVTASAAYTPTTGNTLIVFCPYMAFGSTQPTSITVTDGTNTYVQDSNYFATGDIGSGGTRYPAFSIFRSSNVTGGSFTITCTLAPGGYNAVLGIYVTEWTGIATSSPLDGTANATITSVVGGTDSGALTTTNGTDLLLGIYVLPSSGTFTGCIPGSGFVFLSGDNTTATVPSAIFARNVPTAASRHATCVFTGTTSRSVAGQIAYKLQ